MAQPTCPISTPEPQKSHFLIAQTAKIDSLGTSIFSEIRLNVETRLTGAPHPRNHHFHPRSPVFGLSIYCQYLESDSPISKIQDQYFYLHKAVVLKSISLETLTAYAPGHRALAHALRKTRKPRRLAQSAREGSRLGMRCAGPCACGLTFTNA